MGNNLYLGAYIKIPRQEEKVIKKFKICSSPSCKNVKTGSSDKFCNICGNPIIDDSQEITRSYDPSGFWWNLCKDNEKLGDNFYTFDPENYLKKNYFIYIPNIKTPHDKLIEINIKEDGEYILPSQVNVEQAKEMLETDFKKEIDMLKNAIGIDNVHIDFGFLRFTW